MIPVTTFAGQDGRRVRAWASGLAACRALLAGGAGVVAADDNARGQGARPQRRAFRVEDSGGCRLEPVRRAGAGAGRAADPSRAALDGAQGAGRGRRDHRRHRAVLPRAGDCAAPQAPFVAITGTNGKSTTTALIAHILRVGRTGRADGRQHRHRHPGAGAAGARTACHVIEMSSFQIELTPSLAPSIGVLLNISPDHLDRHGTMEHYAALKARLVARAAPAGHRRGRRLVPRHRRAAAACRARLGRHPLGAQSRVPHGWYAVGSELVASRAVDGAARRLRRPCRHRLAARRAQHPERAGRQRRRR